MNPTEEVQARLAAVVKPLQDELAKLDQAIEQREAELAEFRTARTRLKGAMKGLVPSENGDRPKAGKKKYYGPSAEKLTASREWLLMNRELLLERGDFWASQFLATYPSFPIKNDSQVRKALRDFHAEGLLTLVRVGQGGSKMYRAV